MRINARLLLITFLTVAIISVTSTLIFYSLSTKILYKQQTKSLLNSLNQFIYYYQSDIDDFNSELNERIKNENFNLEHNSKIDFIFIVENDSIINPHEFFSTKIDNPKTISVNEFLNQYSNSSITTREYNNKKIYAGILINQDFLLKISKKINSNIALLINNSPVEISNEKINSAFTIPLIQSMSELKDKNTFDLAYKELESTDFYATVYFPNIKNDFIDQHQTFLIFNTPKEEFDFRETLRFLIFIVISTGLSISLIMVLLFTTKMRKQISLLTSATKTIRGGNINYRVDVISKDELGELGHTFNDMLDEIEKRDLNEKDYTEFISLINQNPTLREISDAALHKIITLTKLTFGILSIIDDDEIRKISTFGLVDLLSSDSINKKFYKEVVKNEKPVEINFDENFPKIKTGLTEITIKYLLIFPIINNNKVIAILELASESKPKIDVKSYINSINKQLAVGLANALSLEQLENLVSELKKLNENYLKQNEFILNQNDQLKQLSSELKNKANELEAERERALELTRVKSQFLASMSHELKTPLNSILGLSELVENDSSILPRTKDRMKIILKNGKKLLNLIINILEFSKLDTGRLEQTKTLFVLNEFLDDLYLTMKPLFFGKDISFEIKFSNESELLLNTDKIKLEFILSNLISNAAKFTQKGSVIVKVELPNDSDISFSVTDTGSGIPDEEKEIIFEEFVQTKESIAKKIGGAGLGLAIASKYTNILGGNLALETTVGKGSTFHFIIPEIVVEKVALSKDSIEEKNKAKTNILLVGSNNEASIPIQNFLISEDIVFHSYNSDKNLPKIDLIFICANFENHKDIKAINYFMNDKRFYNTPNIFITLNQNKQFFFIKNFNLVNNNFYEQFPKKNILGIATDIRKSKHVIDGSKLNNFEIIDPSRFELEDNYFEKFDEFLITVEDNIIQKFLLMQLNSFTQNKRISIFINDSSDFVKLQESIRESAGKYRIDIYNLTEEIFNILDIPFTQSEPIEAKKQKINNENTKQILIVDDDKDTLYTVSEILKNIGFDTIKASNGAECLEKLKSLNPDCILLDIRMPVMDGFQTIKKIRNIPAYKDIKVLALTAHAMLEEKEIIKLSGFDDLVTKPVNSSILISKIKKLLQMEDK